MGERESRMRAPSFFHRISIGPVENSAASPEAVDNDRRLPRSEAVSGPHRRPGRDPGKNREKPGRDLRGLVCTALFTPLAHGLPPTPRPSTLVLPVPSVR